jgi:hypothetical protein
MVCTASVDRAKRVAGGTGPLPHECARRVRSARCGVPELCPRRYRGNRTRSVRQLRPW